MVVELLCLLIEEVVAVDTRTHGCLVVLDLKTVEDLVRFIKENGFQKLLKTKYFGKLSLEKFKASLIQERIIDESENSYLFEYIS